MAAYRSLGSDLQDNIQKIIILGQYGDYTSSLDGNAYSTNDLANSESFQTTYSSNLVVGDEFRFGLNGNGISNNYVQANDGVSHMALTTDMQFFSDILDEAGLPCNINGCP